MHLVCIPYAPHLHDATEPALVVIVHLYARANREAARAAVAAELCHARRARRAGCVYRPPRRRLHEAQTL